MDDQYYYLHKDYALEWYEYGLAHKNDAIVKFMMYWIAFNWLYGKLGRHSDRGGIEAFCNKYYDNLSKYDAFSSPEIEIFLRDPVKDMRSHNNVPDGRKTKEEEFWEIVKNGSGKERVKYLLYTLLTVRNNLFHGAKFPHCERDLHLVEASSAILERYLATVVNEDPLQILADELAEHGLNRTQQVEMVAGVEDPIDQLDFAEWLAYHRDASREEMLKEKHRIMRKRMEIEGRVPVKFDLSGD